MSRKNKKNSTQTQYYRDPYGRPEEDPSFTVPLSKVTNARPRRNYWGNLHEEDTLKGEVTHPNDNYFYNSDNDNHDYYYYYDDDY